MNGRINDELLERLVSYEGYVEHLFSQAAQRLWLEMQPDAVRDYEKLKALKKHISALVDFAFCRFGVEHGLMRIKEAGMPSELNEDLETLAVQLQKVEWDFSPGECVGCETAMN